ncbi:hypothetical protein JX265_013188 [Neoarthrinium moseri]|uniref:Glucose-methanol-choline oxidoreductase N-terminal domain-containing protein n=1 Tax=Neoarthrinium moseri TaxID=1658444 RepID=A0A9P9W8Z3_9PEZI|nr:hypothetical protein JX265_013188 [Neoarthrinium moseri]
MWSSFFYPQCSPTEVDGKAYDYIVVGGGTAGCVIASRLSENPDVTVLVLEKGGVRDNLVSRMPLFSQNFFAGDMLQIQSSQWTEPMTVAYSRKNQLWTAEGIGGASRINAMLWTRGSPGDFMSWYEMGLDDWAWDKVLPHFRKLENASPHSTSYSHGLNGPVELRQDTYPFLWTSYIEKAAHNLGLKTLKDLNDPATSTTGLFPLDTAINRHGERVSAYNAYLSKQVALQRRRHLTVCTGAVVTRLEVDGQQGLVQGVHFRPLQGPTMGSSADCFVKAKREVIVCCGAIGTPQVLMLSGIGPSEINRRGVPLIKELPAVGATLSDHYAIPIMLEVPKNETLRFLQSLWGLWHLLLWLLLRRGLMRTSSVVNAIFLRSDLIDEKTMEITAKNMDSSIDSGTSKPHEVPDVKIMLIPLNTLERDVPGRSLLSLYPTIVQPRGLGRVELVDQDPLSQPRITHPLLLDSHDFIVARRAIRFTMRLDEEFQNSGYPYTTSLVFAPGNRPELLREWEESGVTQNSTQSNTASSTMENKTWKNVTDDEIDDYMKRVAHTAFHFSCTCRMSRSIETGVVDQRLRVHGFKNLRLADASVFPKIPSGHTMAPVMMVAERCADFIKDAWKPTVD